MAPRETENNAYAKFWGDKQRALWYVMVFSGVVNCLLCLKCGAYSSKCGIHFNKLMLLVLKSSDDEILSYAKKFGWFVNRNRPVACGF